MTINQLARDFIAARQEAERLEIGDLGWEDAKVKELRLAAKIKSWLLHKPLVLSEDTRSDADSPGDRSRGL